MADINRKFGRHITVQATLTKEQCADAAERRHTVYILAKVRSGMVDDACLNALNARYNPNFVTPKEGGWIRLTTHNAMAQQYNDACLNAIEATSYTFRAIISGNFPEKSYPADETLTLKVGAQVMFIKNDPSPAKRFYNGKIGTVTSVTWDDEEECQVVMVHSHEDGQDIAVFPLQWENTKYTIDEETKEIKEEVDGTFVQHPFIAHSTASIPVSILPPCLKI